MKICNWNINSITSRKNLLTEWIKNHNPDIILLQEIKTIESNFPKEIFEDLGYNLAICGEKSYNGVAILSKYPFEEIINNFKNNPIPEQARYIEVVITVESKAIRLVSVYVPNGQDFDSEKYQLKIQFLKALQEHMKKVLSFNEIQIIGGDFNIAHEDIDTYNSNESANTVLFAPKMRKMLNGIINAGWHDLFRRKHPHDHQYSWWDYRGGSWHKNRGLRIDYIFGSPEALDTLDSIEYHQDARGKPSPSDHIPIICSLNLKSANIYICNKSHIKIQSNFSN